VIIAGDGALVTRSKIRDLHKAWSRISHRDWSILREEIKLVFNEEYYFVARGRTVLKT